jgi:hypothetical protein
MLPRSILFGSTLLILPGATVFAFAAEHSVVRSAPRPSGENVRAVVANPTRDRILPYVYDGAGWSTTFVLTNLDNRTINLRLEFTGNDGSDLQFPVLGIGTTSAVDIKLGQGGTISVSTADIAGDRTSGYAFVGVPNQTDRFAGYAVVRQQTNGLPDLEFTIPVTPIDENQFVLPMDNTNGFVTFISLVNSSTQNPANVNVTVQDQDGNVLATDQLQIVPLGRLTFNVSDRYPQLNNLVGSILFSASGNQFVTGLGLRSGPNSSLTAIPPFSLPVP